MSLLRDQQHATFPHKIPFGNLISDPPSWSSSVITRKYTRKRFIPQVCFDIVLNPGYAWLLLAACVDCALVHKGYEGDLSTVLVVFLGALVRLTREIYQEYQRFALDSKVNSEVYKVWDGQEFQDKPRSRIQCGDLLLVDNGQQVAADCVLFASERPNGSCYVDNSSTLCSAEMTVKYAVSDIQRYAEGESFEKLTSSLGKLVGIMKIQAPNEDFSSFSGQLRLSKSPSAVLLTLTNFILRGSRVFGAKWVLCCVVATGMETKAMLNARPNRRNRSKLEEMVHKYTRFAIGISLVAIICNLIGYVSVESNHFTTQMVVWWGVSRYYRLVPGLLYLLIDLVAAFQTLQSNHSPYFQG
jgi:magnesium-transporting ATPase (P-type)